MELTSTSQIETTQNSYALTEYECAALVLLFGSPFRMPSSVSNFRDTLCAIQQRKEMQLQHALNYFMTYRTWYDNHYLLLKGTAAEDL